MRMRRTRTDRDCSADGRFRVKGREVLAANSSAQLKERHTDDQRVSCKPSYKFHGPISTDCKVKTIQPSTDNLMSLATKSSPGEAFLLRKSSTDRYPIIRLRNEFAL
jgi:hypothetical protein